MPSRYASLGGRDAARGTDALRYTQQAENKIGPGITGRRGKARVGRYRKQAMRQHKHEEEATERKVAVGELRPGMYVSRLDRPWLESPFLLQGFLLEDWDQVREVQDACAYVYVENARSVEKHEPDNAPGLIGARVSQPPQRNPRHAADAQAGRNVQPDETQYSMDQAALGAERAQPAGQAGPARPTTRLRDELKTAHPLIKETRKLVARQIADARNGRSLDTPAARECVEEITESVLRNPDALVCLSALKKRDEYTYLHSLSVCILSIAFGRHLGLPRESLRDVGLGAFLHDIGKMWIPDNVLNKPGALTPEEAVVMRKHPEYGVEIVGGSERIPERSREAIYSHHERLDGSGYTQGKSGGRIDPLVPVVSVCDTYDAIISHRPYQQARSPLDATAELYRSRGHAFAEELVYRFIGFIGIYPVGSLVELRTGEVGVVVASNEKRLRPRLCILLDANHERLQSPYYLDLARTFQAPDGRPLEILRSLETGAHGLDPAELTVYMP